jgi:hypothetical protein
MVFYASLNVNLIWITCKHALYYNTFTFLFYTKKIKKKYDEVT